MKDFLINLSTHHVYLVYILIIMFACLEGPVFSILFGILIRLGYFSFTPIYIALMLGDMVGDTIWYWIGRKFGYPFVRKYGKYFSITEENIHKVERIFHTYQKSILIISKLTTGFGFAIVTLFTAGLVKIPFRTYTALNFLGQFVWTALLIGVGYYFSYLYVTFENSLSRLSLIALFVILVASFIGFSRFIKERMTS
jgi:membrane protein DedA with SNARE-associated domain